MTEKTSNTDTGDTISAEIGDVENSAIAAGYKNIVGSTITYNIQQIANAAINALHQLRPLLAALSSTSSTRLPLNWLRYDCDS